MRKVIFEEDSVINTDTNLTNFVPPYPGWNYVRLHHPEDKFDIYKSHLCGKWLVFVPHEEFVDVFRKLATLAKNLQLTHAFKASGTPSENGEHVFCIYCSNSTNISFVRKVANTLLDEGFLEKYGYGYRDGTKALFYKTDSATHYMSQSRGKSLTLFRFTDNKELFVKEFHDGNPHWKLITNDNNPSIIENFNEHLMDLEMDSEEPIE